MKQEINYQENQHQEEELEFSLKSILTAALQHIWLIVLFLILALAGGYFYNQQATRIYNVEATLLLDAKDQEGVMQQLILKDHFPFQQRTSPIDNTKHILTARSTLSQVIDNLGLKISYYQLSRITTRELYEKEAPFNVEGELTNNDLSGHPFEVEILDDNYFQLSFSQNSTSYSERQRFGEWIITDQWRFRLVKNQPYFNNQFTGDNAGKNNFEFLFNRKETLIRRYQSALSLETASRESTIMNISLEEPIPQRGIDFVNELMDVFLELNLSQKVQTAENTVAFIDNEIKGIEQQLDEMETQIRVYKEDKGVIGIDKETEHKYELLREYDERKALLVSELTRLDMLQNYVLLSKDHENVIVPSALQIDEPILFAQIQSFVELLKERRNVRMRASEQSPTFLEIEQRLESTREGLIENIKFVRTSKEKDLERINKKISEIAETMRTIPEREFELLRLQRKFNLNESLYLQFLEKKSDAEISRASMIPDHRVVDRAIYRGPIKPSNRLNYLIALVLGLMVPSGFIFLKYYFDDTIKDHAQIEKYSNIPSIGVVGHNSKKSTLVIADHPKSSISEAFRSIRTNLQFLSASSKESQVIVVSSVVGGEGKTFISLNTATVLAYAGKKVALLGVDLRKPQIHKEFGIENNRGISNYLVGQNELSEITTASGIQNLDIFLSGPIPPNPSEILIGERMEQMIFELKEKYDVIIMDTPPVGLVTDASILMKYANVTIFVARQGYSKINYISTINSVQKTGDFKNVFFVINDFKAELASYGYGSYAYGYGSGYGYGYGYGYYEEDKIKPPLYKKIGRAVSKPFKSLFS